MITYDVWKIDIIYDLKIYIAETPRPIQENGGYINTGFIMEPTAPPYTDFNSAPPSYDDVVNGDFCK